MAAVYFIASYDVTDPGRYERDYVPAVLRTLAAAGGEVVVASGSARRLEGAAPGQTVVLRFSSEDAFRSWYDGNDYAPLLQLRLDTTTNGTAVLAKEFPEAVSHSAGSAARSGPPGKLLQAAGDLMHVALGGGDGHHEVVHGVVGGRGHAGVVDLQKDGGGKPAQALVAVDEGVVVDDGLQQSCGLRPDGRVGVVTPDRGLGPSDR